MRMAHAITEVSSFTTNCTFSHDCTSLTYIGPMQTTTKVILAEEKLFGKHFMNFFGFLFSNNMVYYQKIVKHMEDSV
jgi:hypothetical protein